MQKLVFTLILVMLFCANAFAEEGMFEAQERQLKQERAQKLAAYLGENPAMAAVVARIEADYYVDLSRAEFSLDPSMGNDEYFGYLVRLYDENRLDASRSVPVYFYQFSRHEEDGNSFLDLLAQLAKQPFGELLPTVSVYHVAIIDADGKNVGTANCAPLDDALQSFTVFPWDGNTIETYTLKISATMLGVLAQTPLDLDNMRVHNVSFSGYHGAVFYDDKHAYFTPVMGEGWTSHGGLHVNRLYPLEEAIKVFEKIFES